MKKSKKTATLGSTNITVSRIGIGTNRWKKGENDSEIYQVYKTLLDKNVNFFDTAEIYTNGKSELLLGTCNEKDGRPATIASKYQPKTNRRTKNDFNEALDNSLKRLGVETIDLYYIHRPPEAQGIEELMDYMAKAYEMGKIRSVGVSNFDANQMKKAADRLEEHGISLAANQVEYSLLKREPENNGVLEACNEMKVSLVAYRPLASGRLTSAAMSGTHLGSGDNSVLESDLGAALISIAKNHEGQVGQVALNWLLHRGDLVIPIPGSTSLNHAEKNAETLEWELTSSEFEILEKASSYE